jgi:hypothetical protein
MPNSRFYENEDSRLLLKTTAKEKMQPPDADCVANLANEGPALVHAALAWNKTAAKKVGIVRRARYKEGPKPVSFVSGGAEESVATAPKAGPDSDSDSSSDEEVVMRLQPPIGKYVAIPPPTSLTTSAHPAKRGKRKVEDMPKIENFELQSKAPPPKRRAVASTGEFQRMPSGRS